jgi:hypothetical protein
MIHFLFCMQLGNRELKVLVDLALLSAKGQGDQSLTRVHCLQSAVMGYSSLIYNVTTRDGLKQFLGHCKALFQYLKTDPNLPKKLARSMIVL